MVGIRLSNTSCRDGMRLPVADGVVAGVSQV